MDVASGEEHTGSSWAAHELAAGVVQEVAAELLHVEPKLTRGLARIEQIDRFGTRCLQYPSDFGSWMDRPVCHGDHGQ